MKLSRKNYAVVALSAFMLSVATVGVLAFDDRANAAAKGVELQAPVGCARQFISTDLDTQSYSQGIKSQTKAFSRTFKSLTKAWPTGFSTSTDSATQEAC